MHFERLLAVLGLVALWGACTPTFPCINDSECSSGRICINEQCEFPADSGLRTDAGFGDSGVNNPDTGVRVDSGVDQDTGVAPDTGAANALVDISNIRLTGGGLNAAGTAELAYIQQTYEVFFDFAVRASPDCPSCRSQLVVGAGTVVACVFDDSPGLSGMTGRVQEDLAAPGDEPMTYDVVWKLINAVDCTEALTMFAAAEVGNVLGMLDVRHGLGPMAQLQEPDAVPQGDAEHCATVTCPAGMYALGGGGYYGGNHDVTFSGIESDQVFRRCVVGERPDANPAGTPHIEATCSAVPGGDVTLRPYTFQTTGSQEDFDATCMPGEVLLGGGGGAPVGWTMHANYPVVSATSERVWRIRGEGQSGLTVTVQAVCATNVVEPMLAVNTTVLPLGGQCAGVDCPEGYFHLSGGGWWGSNEPDQNQPGNLRHWSVCAINGGGGGPGPNELRVTALCSPFVAQ